MGKVRWYSHVKRKEKDQALRKAAEVNIEGINGKTEEDLETVCGGTHKKDEHQSGRDPYVLSNPIRENEDSKQREKEEEVGRMNPIF